LFVIPTATHSDVLGQAAPIKVVSAMGIAERDHVAPSFAVVAMAPCPTPTQCDESAQATESSLGNPAGRGEAVQLFPPSPLVEATAAPPLSAPTATHWLVEGHEMASKFPYPGWSPPAIGKVGAEL
jgi:hypothetical protein